MICFDYTVADAAIPEAGKGLFTAEDLDAGRILVAPDRISDICKLHELTDEKRASASTRWFEDTCTVAEHWPDECYINHSFTPNSQWHLGFTIALRPIKAGEEITMDYSHLLAEGVDAFTDTETGRVVRGLPWKEAYRIQLSSVLKAISD